MLASKCYKRLREAQALHSPGSVIKAVEFLRQTLLTFKVFNPQILCKLCFHLSNARQSKTFYDIVFVIDAIVYSKS
jgi:hypothetical protein